MSNTAHNSLRTFLCGCSRLPARLTVEETAIILGFSEHDIRILVSEGMLKTLGSPAKNAPKFFAAVEVQSVGSDPAWLSKATRAVAKHWKARNGTDAKGLKVVA